MVIDYDIEKKKKKKTNVVFEVRLLPSFGGVTLPKPVRLWFNLFLSIMQDLSLYSFALHLFCVVPDLCCEKPSMLPCAL
jgi:hypothetical protein